MAVSGNPAIIIEAARPSSLRDSPTGSCPFPGTDVPGSQATSLRDLVGIRSTDSFFRVDPRAIGLLHHRGT